MTQINRPTNMSWFSEISSAVSAKIPSTYLGRTAKELKGSNTVLDVGCGPGVMMFTLNKGKKMAVTGVDLFDDYLERCRKIGVYSELIKSDVREVPFGDNTFDTVLLSHVIEHLVKEDGYKLLEKLEKIAKRKVVILTPIGFLEQDEYDGNPLQEHKSAWTAEDFVAKGYNVYCQGLQFFHQDNWFNKILGKVGPLRDLITIILSPWIRHNPKICYQVICTKILDKKPE